ncbi:MAG: hypothetical protein O7F11_08895 [Acidobacteria bacterium]|nr:hypothetical protein [Acidobacteriota bacterium]MCZ6833849.1 hypothetical protein [Acidobacteriota bacterium]
MSKRDPQGFYRALNISAHASAEEILLSYRFLKQTFRERRTKLDIGLIQEAYETLSDQERRSEYDVLSRPGAGTARTRARNGTVSRFSSPVLLLCLMVVFIVVLAVVKGPDLRAAFISFHQGDQLYLMEDDSSLGTVVAYEGDHRFHNGVLAPAYLLRRAGGHEEWYPARDLARISKAR